MFKWGNSLPEFLGELRPSSFFCVYVEQIFPKAYVSKMEKQSSVTANILSTTRINKTENSTYLSMGQFEKQHPADS